MNFRPATISLWVPLSRVIAILGVAVVGGMAVPTQAHATCQGATNGTTCDDGNSCTGPDGCLDGVCVGAALPNNTTCNDGDLCTGPDRCQNGVCQGIAIVCADDGNPCTLNDCVAGAGCVYPARTGACDDGDHCTENDQCEGGMCVPGPSLVCEDGIDCTVDGCDPDFGCTFGPDHAACDDGLFCNGQEYCDMFEGCRALPPPNCDDGVACTEDRCNEAARRCVSVPRHEPCDDGIACTADHCDPVRGCIRAPDDALCDDGLFCSGVWFCDPAMGCVQEAEADCDDGIECTIDLCDLVADECRSNPDDTACDDGVYCNGIGFCDPAGGCVPVRVECVDGMDCTLDACDEAARSCVFTPVDTRCADGNACTADRCDAVAGCTHEPLPEMALCGAPGSGLYCMGGVCTPACRSDAECDDGIVCTDDHCDLASSECQHLATDAACDDGSVCTGAERCLPGHLDANPDSGCLRGLPLTCDDGVDCTADTCDPVAGCAHVPEASLCDDGVFCNGAEVCDPLLGCRPGTPPNCDDGAACTTDHCDVVANRCIHTSNDAFCDDNRFCTGVERCSPLSPGADPASGCLVGIPMACDDGAFCTEDRCDDALAACRHDPVDSRCDDGVFCNGAERCEPSAPGAAAGTGCVRGATPDCEDGVACTADECDPGTDACRHLPDDTVCDNGRDCDGAEVCDLVRGCVSGLAQRCDDGIDCTEDGCDDATGRCLHTPRDTLCDDNDACTGHERCDLLTGCVAGFPLRCDDGIDCTHDSCLSDRGCVFEPDATFCDDGRFCNGVERCERGQGCRPGSRPNCDDGFACTADGCDDAAGCRHAPVDAICDDGLFCTGVERCRPDAPGHDSRGCLAGVPIDCDDGIACTAQYCDEDIDRCRATPDDAFCSDGDLCNGAERCRPGLADADPATGCMAGPAVNCDDGIPCTDDRCLPLTGACIHDTIHTRCDDGNLCTGPDLCVVNFGCMRLFLNDVPCQTPDGRGGSCGMGICQARCLTDEECDDGIECTVEACEDESGLCLVTPRDSFCSDGAFCNGVESCSPVLGCVPGDPTRCDDGVPCTAAVCDRLRDECVFIPVHSQCDDGLFCNGTEVCDPQVGCRPGDEVRCFDAYFCTRDFCDEALRGCLAAPVDTLCDDRRHCNGREHCDPDAPSADPLGCAAGTPPDCDDGIACTIDQCDDNRRACLHQADPFVCRDLDQCNGRETCDLVLGCVSVDPIICDDGIPCTLDGCLGDTGECTHTPRDALCDDGLACNGVERCDIIVGCQVGVGVICDDGVDCTHDRCRDPDGTCEFLTDDRLCDNSLFCDGMERCVATSGCAQGEAPTCADGIDCTMDTCDNAAGACHFEPNHAVCDNENACDGAETCNPSTGCVAGEAPVCDDGIPCTVDTCSPTNGCVATPNHSACPDTDPEDCLVAVCGAQGCESTTVADGTACGAGGSGHCETGECRLDGEADTDATEGTDDIDVTDTTDEPTEGDEPGDPDESDADFGVAACDTPAVIVSQLPFMGTLGGGAGDIPANGSQLAVADCVEGATGAEWGMAIAVPPRTFLHVRAERLSGSGDFWLMRADDCANGAQCLGMAGSDGGNVAVLEFASSDDVGAFVLLDTAPDAADLRFSLFIISEGSDVEADFDLPDGPMEGDDDTTDFDPADPDPTDTTEDDFPAESDEPSDTDMGDPSEEADSPDADSQDDGDDDLSEDIPSESDLPTDTDIPSTGGGKKKGCGTGATDGTSVGIIVLLAWAWLFGGLGVRRRRGRAAIVVVPKGAVPTGWRAG